MARPRRRQHKRIGKENAFGIEFLGRQLVNANDMADGWHRDHERADSVPVRRGCGDADRTWKRTAAPTRPVHHGGGHIILLLKILRDHSR